MIFVSFSIYGKIFDILVYTSIYCVGAGLSILISFSDGLVSYVFRRKLEKVQPVREEMDGKVFFHAKVGISPVIVILIEVFFPICTLT